MYIIGIALSCYVETCGWYLLAGRGLKHTGVAGDRLVGDGSGDAGAGVGHRLVDHGRLRDGRQRRTLKLIKSFQYIDSNYIDNIDNCREKMFITS